MESMSFHYKGIMIEINNRKLPGKSPNIWEFKNILLNKPWIKEEIKGSLKSSLEKMKIVQNVQDATKAVFRGKFIKCLC